MKWVGLSSSDAWNVPYRCVKVHNTNVIDLSSVSSYRRLMDLLVMWSCRQRTQNSVSCYNYYYLYEIYNISTTIEHIVTDFSISGSKRSWPCTFDMYKRKRKCNLSKQEKSFIKYKPVHDTTWYAAKTIHIHLATNYKLKYSTFWYLIQIIYFFHMCVHKINNLCI